MTGKVTATVVSDVDNATAAVAVDAAVAEDDVVIVVAVATIASQEVKLP